MRAELTFAVAQVRRNIIEEGTNLFFYYCPHLAGSWLSRTAAIGQKQTFKVSTNAVAIHYSGV